MVSMKATDNRFGLSTVQPCGDSPDPASGNDGDFAISTTNGKLFRKYGGLGWQEFTGGGGSSGPKVYRALLSQSGTDAPVATVFENTLGGVPVWSRNAEGDYRLTLAGAFTSGKTFCLAGSAWFNGNSAIVSLSWMDGDTVSLSSWGNTVSPGGSPHLVSADMFIDVPSVSIEILVYP